MKITVLWAMFWMIIAATGLVLVAGGVAETVCKPALSSPALLL
jgi:hypothetical protein